MFPFPSLFIIFLFVPITLAQHIIRGEKTRCALSCPIPNALWFGPKNQSIVAKNEKYELKHSFDHVQLSIAYLTFLDQGEYLCRNNQTNAVIQRYQLSIGSMSNLLELFFLSIFSILLVFPVFWFLGEKYSAINQ